VTATPRTRHARELFAGIAGDYDRWAQLLSFGQDARWHDAMVERLAPALPDRTGRAVDVATGTAAVAIAIARRYGCRVTAVDQSPEMLARGRLRVAEAGLERRVELVEGRAEELPVEDGSADALTHTYLLRYVDDPAAAIRELARVVRPGGRIAMLEFFVPPRPLLYPAWWVYTRAGLPALGRLVSRDWYEVGRFLGPSIDGFWRAHPLPAVVEMWRDAGIDSVEARKMSLGGGVVMWGVRQHGRA
jgi:demethylmenaquinone methyltransferase / 2-methoxy-6-polyprenyl-1,4-benzoquinol methylase